MKLIRPHLKMLWWLSAAKMKGILWWRQGWASAISMWWTRLLTRLEWLGKASWLSWASISYSRLIHHIQSHSFNPASTRKTVFGRLCTSSPSLVGGFSCRTWFFVLPGSPSSSPAFLFRSTKIYFGFLDFAWKLSESSHIQYNVKSIQDKLKLKNNLIILKNIIVQYSYAYQKI